MTPTIAVIGAGNMGACLIGGLIKHGHPPHKIWASDTDEEKLSQLQTSLQIQTTTDNHKAVQVAQVIIFAIKPQFFADVAKKLRDIIQNHRPLIISIAAGIKIDSMESWLGESLAIVRTMPNIPALIGDGATALFANRLTTLHQKKLAEHILQSVGITVWVEEETLLDTVTALSGSGPAYFFLIMQALQEAAQELGLPKEIAKRLTLQTALGAANMAIHSEKTLAELRQDVTSKAGTTEKAIYVLENHNIREILQKALQAAKLRSEEIAETMGK